MLTHPNQKDSSSEEFYSRTVTALDKKETSDRDVAHKLQEVKEAAKAQKPIEVSSPQKPIAGESHPKEKDTSTASEGSRANADIKVDEEKSVAGRKTMKGGVTKDVHSGKESPKESPKEVDKQKAQEGGDASDEVTTESNKDHEIETELNSILKKGPSKSPHPRMAPLRNALYSPRLTVHFCIVIIFSKTYCPHSAKAKKILLEKYTIVPAPYVVELDTHPLGQGLQNALEKSTGRRTVPNVLVNGRSIGGGDDLQALDGSGGLVEKVTGMAGKRIVEARLTEGK